MDRDELVRTQMASYLNRVDQQYSPRRHATIVAHMVLTFIVSQHEAESAVHDWLKTRTPAVN